MDTLGAHSHKISQDAFITFICHRQTLVERGKHFGRQNIYIYIYNIHLYLNFSHAAGQRDLES